jgi:hypothetical protein
MKKLSTLLVGAALVATSLSSAVHAGSNRCTGAVKIGNEWTTVISDLDDYAPAGCRFKTASKLGRRILAVCPDGTEQCIIDIKGLDNRSPTITAIDSVVRDQPTH